jgi:peptidoglycan/xylan/chitin deacetylase (PgdA/CDA1 family)
MRVPRLMPLVGGRAGRLFQRRARRSDAPIGLVMLHHEIAPTQGDPGRELVPAMGAAVFRAQLERLKRDYEVVPLSEVVPRAQQRSAGELIPVAITFDDDLANHATVAAPILEEFGFTATFFLCGNSLAGPAPFWWQDLQVLLNRGPDAWPKLRQRLAEEWSWASLEGQISDFTNTIEASGLEQHNAISALLRELVGSEILDEGLSAQSVKDLVGAGFEVGFHTRHHYSLRMLDAEELEREMHEGVPELEEVTGQRPTTIAYPHAHADLRIAEAAQRAGFGLGFVAGHAATRADQHPLLRSRMIAGTAELGTFDWALGRVASAG